MSWWSRKSNHAHKHPPALSPSLSPVSPYDHHPHSAGPVTSPGLLDPYDLPVQSRKDSAPARLHHNEPSRFSPISPTGVGPSNSLSAPASRKSSRPNTAESRSGPSSATNSTLSISNFFGLNAPHPKRPSSSSKDKDDSRQIASTGSVRIDTSLASAGSVRNRDRAYSSASTATTNHHLPITPSEWGEDSLYLSPINGRGRSNSASSQPSSIKRTRQPPALVAVEEYDPFAAGLTQSIIIPTPPIHSSETQGSQKTFLAQQPDPRMLRARAASDAYRPIAQAPPVLRIPAVPPQKMLTSPVSAGSTGSAGPFGKKPHLPLLPFRSKSQKEKNEEKKKVAEDTDSLKGEASYGSHLLPHHANRNSAYSSSSGGTDASLNERPRLLSNNSAVSSVSVSRLPTLRTTPHAPPPSSDLSSTKTGTTRQGGSTVTSPATSPSQPGCGSSSRPLSNSSSADMSHIKPGGIPGGGKGRHAALALSLDDPAKKDIVNIHLEVDVLDTSSPPPPPKLATPVVSGEDEGAFEFLLPPKTPGALMSPHYGAPSFIAESVSSPADQFYFASPYPSGVTQLPVLPGMGPPMERVEEEGAKPEGPDVEDALVALEKLTGGSSSSSGGSNSNSKAGTPKPSLNVSANSSRRNSPPTLPPPTLDLPAPPTTVKGYKTKPLKIPGKTCPAPPSTTAPPAPAPSSPSPSPISPVQFRPNPLMKNIDATLSSLSFSSSISERGRVKAQQSQKRGKSRSQSRPESDVDELPISGSRRRRGSEPTSLRSAAVGILSSSPPSAFPSSSSRKGSLVGMGTPSSPPATPRQSRSQSSSSFRGRMAQFVSGSGSASEEGTVTSSGGGGGSLKRRKSFNHNPILPPMPSLRHYASFNPVLSPAPEKTPPPPPPLGHASKASVSNASVRTEVPRTLRKRLSEVGPKDETLEDNDEGVADEDDDDDLGWAAKRFPVPSSIEDPDFCSRTLNGGSVDGHSSISDHHHHHYSSSSKPFNYNYANQSYSSPPPPPPSRKTSSPSRADFTPMHILPPSELLRLGDADPDDSDDEAVMIRGRLLSLSSVASGEDDLLHGDFDDMPTGGGGGGGGVHTITNASTSNVSLRDPEGASWLTDLGLHPSVTTSLGVAVANKTNSLMPIYKGREPGAGLPLPRALGVRPSTGNTNASSSNSIVFQSGANRRDSAASTGTTQTSGGGGRRPSTAQSPLSPSSAGGGGGTNPLSPPPPRSRLPRSSISSSMRSVPGVLSPRPQQTGLRSRANSNATTLTTLTSAPDAPLPAPPIQHHHQHVPSPTKVYAMPLKDLHTMTQLEKRMKRKESLLGTSARKERMSMKPSFLDIEFEEASGGAGQESSFLDMGRGASIDSVRD